MRDDRVHFSGCVTQDVIERLRMNCVTTDDAAKVTCEACLDWMALLKTEQNHQEVLELTKPKTKQEETWRDRSPQL